MPFSPFRHTLTLISPLPLPCPFSRRRRRRRWLMLLLMPFAAITPLRRLLRQRFAFFFATYYYFHIAAIDAAMPLAISISPLELLPLLPIFRRDAFRWLMMPLRRDIFAVFAALAAFLRQCR